MAYELENIVREWMDHLKGLNVEVKKMFGCYCLYCDGQAVGWIHNSVMSLREVGLDYLPKDIKRPTKEDILDRIIDKLVRQIFERMKAIPKSEIVNARYREKMEERKNLLRSIRVDYTKAADELDMLKAEVIKALRGESTFSKDLLGSMVSEAEAKCTELQKQFEDAQAAYEEGQTVLHSLEEQYDNVISWADLYDTASLEAKKMIVNCLIRRVEVYRGYKLHIDFNIDFTQFSLGLDIVEIAA